MSSRNRYNWTVRALAGLATCLLCATMWSCKCGGEGDDEEEDATPGPSGSAGPDPVNPESATFEDTDRDLHEVSGILALTVPADESANTGYSLYWGSDASTKADETPFDSVVTTGSDINHEIDANTTIPADTTHLLIY